MECDCSIDYWEVFDDHPAVSSVRIVKRTRKEVKCCECGETIAVGQPRESAVQLSDGSWTHWETCIPCKRVREHYCPGGWYYGRLQETVMECLGVDYLNIQDDEEEES